MLSESERRFLAARRVGHLATADRSAAPHVVPVCFAIADRSLYITIDEKPKRPGARLKRVHNIEQNPSVAFVADCYDEDWSRLDHVARTRGNPRTRERARHRAGIAARPLPAIGRDADRGSPGDRGSHRARHELGQLVSPGAS
jgi:PPOX class probable F420-dependent enzyme